MIIWILIAVVILFIIGLSIYLLKSKSADETNQKLKNMFDESMISAEKFYSLTQNLPTKCAPSEASEHQKLYDAMMDYVEKGTAMMNFETENKEKISPELDKQITEFAKVYGLHFGTLPKCNELCTTGAQWVNDKGCECLPEFKELIPIESKVGCKK